MSQLLGAIGSHGEVLGDQWDEHGTAGSEQFQLHSVCSRQLEGEKGK